MLLLFESFIITSFSYIRAVVSVFFSSFFFVFKLFFYFHFFHSKPTSPFICFIPYCPYVFLSRPAFLFLIVFSSSFYPGRPLLLIISFVSPFFLFSFFIFIFKFTPSSNPLLRFSLSFSPDFFLFRLISSFILLLVLFFCFLSIPTNAIFVTVSFFRLASSPLQICLLPSLCLSAIEKAQRHYQAFLPDHHISLVLLQLLQIQYSIWHYSRIGRFLPNPCLFSQLLFPVKTGSIQSFLSSIPSGLLYYIERCFL
ncbi:SYTL [Acanthosepion pharaonis]|uniref:SYTL n=1 Tax=Acanthosepion pharaonis TaxID=158019 RepID=A0A812C850_ACAPH|nr:SYTL [Sepia pharaonis]